MSNIQARIQHYLGEGGRVWLFLDYDGTLADFAPTPDVVIPDPQVISLLKQLALQPELYLAVISGRKLEHIRVLVPVQGIWLAGTYGIELQAPSGENKERLDYAFVRPILDEIKPLWQSILAESSGFFLEDKGWTLAIHARYAADEQADRVLKAAAQAAKERITGTDFKLLGGHRFLEVSPKLADKGLTVKYLLGASSVQNVMPVYIGDDDKDIRAFPIVQSNGGLALLVGNEHQAPAADGGVESPAEVRKWLESTFLG